MLCGLLIATTVGRPLLAQHRSALDVGLSVVHFPDDSSDRRRPVDRMDLVVERIICSDC